MRKAIAFISMLSLAAMLSVAAFAQDTMTKSSKPAAKKTSAPKTDAEIQSCIEGKLAKSAKLKDQGFTVSVSNGEATLTGTAKNAGSKGAATGLAKSCGAKKVTNNITVTASTKTKAKTTPPPK
jgi:osmotically-inducible protein OsmY